MLYSSHFLGLRPINLFAGPQEKLMAGSFAASVRGNQIRLRHIMFAALLSMFLFVLWHDERYLFNHSGEEWAHFFPVRWLLLPHALAGLTALLTGPFQFSS